MTDQVMRGFLQRQYDEGRALARQSDLFSLMPLDGAGGPPDRYLVQFHCRGLIKQPPGEVAEADFFEFGIHFSDSHLRHADPGVVTLLRPWNVFHPNIRGPLCCLGHLSPGTGLVDLIYQMFEIVVYRNWAAHDGLNAEACQWARNNSHRFPVDRRPLKRRSVNLQVVEPQGSKTP